jgi:hypothetical protein
MCTSIIEIVRAEGMAKRGAEWFPLSQTVVAYDHARHAPLGDVITLDFINADLDPGARAGIELTLETAKAPLSTGRLPPQSSRRRKCGARASCSVRPKGEESRLNGRILSRLHAVTASPLHSCSGLSTPIRIRSRSAGTPVSCMFAYLSERS